METKTLKQTVVKGLVWIFVQNVFSKFLYFLSTVWLARILMPADFGVVAITTLVVNVLNIFVDFGISFSLIQNTEKEDEMPAVGLLLTFFFGVLCFFIGVGGAPVIASFFNETTLVPFIQVMSFDLIITAFEVVPLALLNKNLQFKKRVLPEVIFVLLFGIVAIPLAQEEFGAWSIIFGTLIAHAVRTVLYWKRADMRILFLWEPHLVRRIIKYGYHAVGASLLLFFLLNGDNAVIRKLLDNTSLGFYALAYTLANLPATHITHIIGTVTFPVYAQLQKDSRGLRVAFHKILHLITALSLPAGLGLIAIAPLLITTVYGHKWEPIIVPFQILCVFGIIRSILAVCGNVFYAVNKHVILKRIMIVQVGIMAVVVYPLTHSLGIAGTALTINIAQFVAMILIFHYVTKLLEDGFFVVFVPLLKTGMAALCMAFIVSALLWVHILISPFFELVFLTLAGIVLYVFFLRYFNNHVFKECTQFLYVFKESLVQRWKQ